MSKKFDGRKAEIDGRVWIAQDVWENPVPFRKLHTASTICPRQEATDVFHGKRGTSPRKAPARVCSTQELEGPGPLMHSIPRLLQHPFSALLLFLSNSHVHLIRQRHAVC